MVRAARFAAVLGFSVEATALAAIKELNALVDDVSTERIREEPSRILVSPGRAGHRFVAGDGALARILPELQACVGAEQHAYHTEDVPAHVDSGGKHALDPACAWPPSCTTSASPAAWQGTNGEGAAFSATSSLAELAGKILRRLRYDNKTIAVVGKLVRHHMLRLNYPG